MNDFRQPLQRATHSNAIWVELAHFVSWYLACYPNPNPNSNRNPNPYPNPNPNSNPNPYPNRNPKLVMLFHKMCELNLFSQSNSVCFSYNEIMILYRNG